MNFLILPNAFKDCMSASKAGECIERGIGKVQPAAHFKTIPIADGGPGTVTTLAHALNGKMMKTLVSGPLLHPVDAVWCMVDEQAAIIEMAAASGLERIKSEERNPMLTTTFGTGQLINTALDNGCSKILLGIGGSATNDGGVGMAMALGVKFLNKDHKSISYGGAALNDIENIDLSAIDKRLRNITIQVLCDVTNPLTGLNGASAIYGPQKGATPEMVTILDRNLKHLSWKIKEQLKIDVEHIPGAGAAGGLGAGLVAFTGAQLVPGFETIADLIHLEEEIQKTEIIISTEGSLDEQTLQGKAIKGIASLTQKYNKIFLVFTGHSPSYIANFQQIGITSIYCINQRPGNLKTALRLGPERLEATVQQVISKLKQ
jgi:glycerate 2-kinase